MLTDNFKIWQRFILTNTMMSDTPQPLDGTLVASAANGSTTGGLTHILCNAANFAQCYSAIDRSLVYFGSGTTPAAVTDVKMESGYFPGLYIADSTSITSEYKNHTAIVTVTSLVQNIGASIVTISEVGWLKGLMLSTSAESEATLKFVLMAREVMTEPVTLGSGGTATFNLKFVF